MESSETESENERENNLFPTFIVIEAVEEDITKVSPFMLQKVISELINPQSVKKIRKNKTLLIQVKTKKDAERLLKVKQINNIKVKAYLHQFLNSAKGVIKSPELSLCTLTEIENDVSLKNQGITNVKRIQINKNDKVINTNTYILTFNKPILPKEIKIGYSIAKVEPYTPNPRRCHNCQKFGHLQNSCNRTSVCRRCGETETEHESPCVRPLSCPNCNERHTADSKECNIWKKEIIKRKCTLNISFIEARRQVESDSHQMSYANIAKMTSQQKVIPEDNTLRNQDLITLISELKCLIELLKGTLSGIKQSTIDNTNPTPSTTNKNDSTYTNLLKLKYPKERETIQEIETLKPSQEKENIKNNSTVVKDTRKMDIEEQNSSSLQTRERSSSRQSSLKEPNEKTKGAKSNKKVETKEVQRTKHKKKQNANSLESIEIMDTSPT